MHVRAQNVAATPRVGFLKSKQIFGRNHEGSWWSCYYFLSHETVYAQNNVILGVFERQEDKNLWKKGPSWCIIKRSGKSKCGRLMPGKPKKNPVWCKFGFHKKSSALTAWPKKIRIKAKRSKLQQYEKIKFPLSDFTE